jgi:hypothetical protein
VDESEKLFEKTETDHVAQTAATSSGKNEMSFDELSFVRVSFV